MPCIRLSRSASITPTGVGVILRSDLGAFQLTGSDVSAFLERMVPLLDGSRDREALLQELSDYSPASVTAFIDLLEARGLIEPCPAPETALDRERFRGQEQFLCKWSMAPGEAIQRIAGARVLVVGLEPWGASAALALAASGIAALHLADDAAAGPGDVAALRERGQAALGAPRREEVASLVRERAPWCQVESSSIGALSMADLRSEAGRFDLLIAAVRGGDAELVERVARLGQQAGLVSLWSHLAGTTAIVGPLVVPGRTACRICATVEALNPPLNGRQARTPAAHERAMAQMLGHLAAMEALKAISEYTPSRIGGRILVQDLSTFETSYHTLVRLPWCRVCGEGERLVQ
jgi:molybdopterin/thiamine biosynthesis adenylyltransferase